jgi:hypothetical protein
MAKEEIESSDEIDLPWMDKNRYKGGIPIPEQKLRKCELSKEFQPIRKNLLSNLDELRKSLNLLLLGGTEENFRMGVYQALETVFGNWKGYTRNELKAKAIQKFGESCEKLPGKYASLPALVAFAENNDLPTGFINIKMPEVAKDIPEIVKQGLEGIFVVGTKTSKRNGTRIEIVISALIQKMFIDDENLDLRLLTNARSPDLPQLCLDIKTSTAEGSISSSTSSNTSSALAAYNQRYLGISHDILLIRIQDNVCTSMNFYDGKDIVDEKVSQKLWRAMNSIGYEPEFTTDTEIISFLQNYSSFLVLTTNKPNETETRFMNMIEDLVERDLLLKPDMGIPCPQNDSLEFPKNLGELHEILKKYLLPHLRISPNTLIELHERWTQKEPSEIDGPTLSTKGFEFSVGYTFKKAINEEE